MLDVLEETPNRLVIKEKRSRLDAIMLAIFVFVPIYFLLILTSNIWIKFGVKESLLKSIYYSPLNACLIVASLLLFPIALSVVLTFGSGLPTRTFTFDRKNNLLTIESTCLSGTHKIEYSLDEIQTVRWFSEPVYAGGTTMVNVQFLRLIRIKPNGKVHLIPIRHIESSKLRETDTAIDLIRRFLTSRS
jgi:hypothetical protein